MATKVEGDVPSLKSSVDEFKAEITDELLDVKKQLASHSQRIENTEDDIERIKRSHDLRITGFPVKDNENLLHIYGTIAKEIGYETSKRIPVKNRTTGEMMKSATMLMHFGALKQKESFYSYYLNKMPLNPEKFGLPKENRIVKGENLTKKKR